MFWRRKRSLDDFKEEIDSQLALEADQIRDAGSSADPDAAARRAFGTLPPLRSPISCRMSTWAQVATRGAG
jgi:hypothetical protein